MFADFNFQQMISAFIVLFAVIDIIGSIPIIINLKEKGKDVNAMKATVISFSSADRFFYAGDMMLKAFSCRYRVFCCGRCFRHIPDVFGDDSRCRNIQESGTH